MKVAIVRGGGIAGMTTRTELASDALSPDDAAELRRRVADSGLLDMASPKPGPALPDEPQYELTVEHDDASHRVRVSERTLPDPVRDLIGWVERHPAREEGIEPPGH